MTDGIMERLSLKFTSGNSTPVERITITLDEFQELEELIAQMELEIVSANETAFEFD